VVVGTGDGTVEELSWEGRGLRRWNLGWWVTWVGRSGDQVWAAHTGGKVVLLPGGEEFVTSGWVLCSAEGREGLLLGTTNGKVYRLTPAGVEELLSLPRPIWAMISEGDKLWILDGKGLERIEDNKVSWTVEAWVAEPGVLVRFGDGVAFAGWLKGVKADDPRLTDYGRSPRMIICVDGRGEVVWRTSVGARVRSLAVVRDEILVGCVDGVAYLVGEGEVRRYLPLWDRPRSLTWPTMG